MILTLVSFSARASGPVEGCIPLSLEGAWNRFSSDVGVHGSRAELDQAVDALLKAHPELKNSAFHQTLQWFDSDAQNLHEAIMQIHVSNFTGTLGVRDADLAELAVVWKGMSRAQKAKSVEKLAGMINDHRLTRVFDDPTQLMADLHVIKTENVELSILQEFNRRWKGMSQAEQKLFLLSTLSDDLPGVLEFFPIRIAQIRAALPTTSGGGTESLALVPVLRGSAVVNRVTPSGSTELPTRIESTRSPRVLVETETVKVKEPGKWRKVKQEITHEHEFNVDDSLWSAVTSIETKPEIGLWLVRVKGAIHAMEASEPEDLRFLTFACKHFRHELGDDGSLHHYMHWSYQEKVSEMIGALIEKMSRPPTQEQFDLIVKQSIDYRIESKQGLLELFQKKFPNVLFD